MKNTIVINFKLCNSVSITLSNTIWEYKPTIHDSKVKITDNIKTIIILLLLSFNTLKIIF